MKELAFADKKKKWPFGPLPWLTGFPEKSPFGRRPWPDSGFLRQAMPEICKKPIADGMWCSVELQRFR